MEGIDGATDLKSHAIIQSRPSKDTYASTASGVKRKRETKSGMKFYAVRAGKQTGIFYDWPECLEQVRGYPKAEFKSFQSLTEAQVYLQNGTGAIGASGCGGETKFYSVQKGRKPGVYHTWPEALEQITGWKGPKHRVFRTRAEAEAFVTAGQHDVLCQSTDIAQDVPPTKKTKLGRGRKLKDENALPEPELDTGGEYFPGDGPLPEDAEDDFDYTITLDQSLGRARYKTAAELTKTTRQASGPVATAPVRIYTDGSSLSNGKDDAHGGVGVFFGPLDRRNISEPLSGSKQTNQRAELTAILRALEVAPRDRKIEIVSDSKYATKCVTEWLPKWRKNNWLNAAHKPVENRDLIQKIVDMLEERFRLNAHRMRGVEQSGDMTQPWNGGPAGVRFTWVKGHAKDSGNTAADELAVNGARVARELGGDLILD